MDAPHNHQNEMEHRETDTQTMPYLGHPWSGPKQNTPQKIECCASWPDHTRYEAWHVQYDLLQLHIDMLDRLYHPSCNRIFRKKNSRKNWAQLVFLSRAAQIAAEPTNPTRNPELVHWHHCESSPFKLNLHAIRHQIDQGLKITFPKIQTLPTKSTLIDLAIFSTWEWESIILQLNNRLRSLPTHILNGILITWETTRTTKSAIVKTASDNKPLELPRKY